MFGLGKPRRPKAVAFDVIGTVFPLEPIRPRLTAIGLRPDALDGWFAAGLRDAFALSAAGDYAPFAEILTAALDELLAREGLDSTKSDTSAVIEAIGELTPRPDAREAFGLLAGSGVRILALTNGSRSTAKKILASGKLDQHVDTVVSTDDVKLSKPRAEVYLRAAEEMQVKPEELGLVAAHGWDVNGAKAAGLVTAYLSADRPLSPVMREPDLTGPTLSDLARQIVGLSA